MIGQVKEDLIIDEGLRLFPYKCTAGKLTIGVGRNLDDTKLSDREIDYLMESRQERYKGGNKFNFLIEDFKEFGISEEEAGYLLLWDIRRCVDQLEKNLSWFKCTPPEVKRVLINMCFNLGIRGLLKFKTTLGLIKDVKYKEASEQMLNSLWAKQVGKRAIRLSNILKNVQ